MCAPSERLDVSNVAAPSIRATVAKPRGCLTRLSHAVVSRGSVLELGKTTRELLDETNEYIAGSAESSAYQWKRGQMQITKNDIPTKIDVPGARVRQATDFGDSSGFATLGAEYISLGAGTDIAPLLEGLDDDTCHSPHWGFIISGEILVSYTNQTEEVCVRDDLFYWPPGHSVRAVKDTEVILFSPQHEHGAVMDHMIASMAG